jgi:hypothetical protein
VYSCTGTTCVLVAVPAALFPKSSPGKSRALIVKVACGVDIDVDPEKLMSGITRLIYVNLSPSAMSITADSIKESIAVPSASYPNS